MSRPFYESESFSVGGGGRLFDNVTTTGANRMPCPVCGHPTGDCVGEATSPGRITGYGDNESLKEKLMFTVEEDIYEETQINSFLKGKVLVYKKGKQIPYLEAEKRNLIK
jgi:hypothetical protein